MVMILENVVSFFNNIKFYISTLLVFDNIDRLEEIFNGEGTLYRIKGIVI